MLSSRDYLLLTSFPGIQKPLDQYGPASGDASGTSPAKDAGGAEEDDDDFDLFGSDDEEAVSMICACQIREKPIYVMANCV